MFVIPYVLGELRKGYASVAAKTECAHCHKPVHLELDSNNEVRVLEEGIRPLVFFPAVKDLSKASNEYVLHGF